MNCVQLTVFLIGKKEQCFTNLKSRSDQKEPLLNVPLFCREKCNELVLIRLVLQGVHSLSDFLMVNSPRLIQVLNYLGTILIGDV